MWENLVWVGGWEAWVGGFEVVRKLVDGLGCWWVGVCGAGECEGFLWVCQAWVWCVESLVWVWVSVGSLCLVSYPTVVKCRIRQYGCGKACGGLEGGY
jgi:hypothetical protein